MTAFLYFLVEKMAAVHDWLMSLNDSYGFFLTDKWLHFFVMGAVGLVLLLVIHPLFSTLAETDHTIVITWIYVFTLMVVLTFGIEIGQGVSGTGSVDLDDVVAGIAGFLAVFLVFAGIRAIWRAIVGRD